MKQHLSWILVVAAAGFASQADAQFFLRGSFNGYDTSLQMTETAPGSNIFTATASGLTPGDKYTFLAADQGYTIQSGAPFQDVAARANAAGEITAIFYNDPNPTDGWRPVLRRLGITGLDYTYELMGSFNGFSSGLALSEVNGILQGVISLEADTAYEFVFRQVGDWNITIKENFGDSGDNIAFTSSIAGDYFVRLDLEGGRYEFAPVPEPSTMAVLAGLGALAAVRRRRRNSR